MRNGRRLGTLRTTLAVLALVAAALVAGIVIGRRSESNAKRKVAAPSSHVATTSTTSGTEEQARELVYQACTMQKRTFSGDAEILSVQSDELRLLAEAASKDTKWQPLYDAWSFWNAETKRSMDSTASTMYLPPGHALDGALATVSRMCASAGVKYAKAP